MANVYPQCHHLQMETITISIFPFGLLEDRTLNEMVCKFNPTNNSKLNGYLLLNCCFIQGWFITGIHPDQGEWHFSKRVSACQDDSGGKLELDQQ